MDALDRLRASGPFAPDTAELMLFGRLVGGWDVEWTAFGPAGSVAERRRGEWRFSWILGGRGVQDVIWVADATPDRDGTTLRCWDPELGAWRAVFMSPADGEFVTLVGRRAGDSIVQEVVGGSGQGAARWTFSDITDHAFRWLAETSSDGGRSWVATHEIRGRRRPA